MMRHLVCSMMILFDCLFEIPLVETLSIASLRILNLYFLISFIVKNYFIEKLHYLQLLDLQGYGRFSLRRSSQPQIVRVGPFLQAFAFQQAVVPCLIYLGILEVPFQTYALICLKISQSIISVSIDFPPIATFRLGFLLLS